MKKIFTSQRLILAFLMLFTFQNIVVLAQQSDGDRIRKSHTKTFNKKGKIGHSLISKNANLVGCGVDSSVNGVYAFQDATGSDFTSFLCGVNDSVSATFGNGYAYYDGDGYFINLFQGSQVTFSLDSCTGHPTSLTICDSTNTPIPGAYSSATCGNSLNFVAPYTGTYIAVMNDNGICGGGGLTGIGQVYCYKQVGTILTSCLPPPPNDSICGALPLTVGGAFYSGNNTTAELIDPYDDIAIVAGFACSTPNNTLWYSFTPTISENVSIVCFTPAVNGLQEWVGVFTANSCNDSLKNGFCYSGGNAADDTVRISIAVTAGTTYYFMVDGVGGAVGSFQIGLESALPAPSNDTICGALPLTVDGPYDNNDNGYALGSDNDDIKATNAGFSCSVPNNTLWYSFTPTITEDVVVNYASTPVNGLNGWLGIFTSTSCFDPLVYDTCFAGPIGLGDTVRTTISVVAGTTYYLMVDGVGGAVGAYALGLTSIPPPPPTPANDSLCGAIPLTVGGPYDNNDNTSASISDNDDLKAVSAGYTCSTPNNTLWYSFTPTVTEDVVVNYASTPVNGLNGWLGVFTATSCSSPLVYSNCLNGPAGTGDTSKNTISVVAGTTYYLMVDGVLGAVGGYAIGLTSVPPPPPTPANDSLCGAFPLTLGGAFYNSDNTSASLFDANDATVAGLGYTCGTPNNTLWYSFLPSITQDVSVNFLSPNGGLDGWLGLFTAPTCNDPLVYVDCYGGPVGIGDTVKTTISVVAGTTYYLMVDGVGGAVGAFGLGITNTVPYPVNDTLCGAIDLVLNGPFIPGNTFEAQASDASDVIISNAGYNCGVPNNTEWFQFTPATTDSFDLVMSALGQGFESWIGEISTTAGANACNGSLMYEQCLLGTNNSFGDSAYNRLFLTAGQTYFFMVDGFANATGVFSIGIKSVVIIGVSEFESNIHSLTVFPNPANEVLNINYSFAHDENVTFQLMDPTGRVLLTESNSGIKNGLKTINVKSINSGIYLLRLLNDKGSVTRKIMIQK